MGKKRKRPSKDSGAGEDLAQKRLAGGPNGVRSHHATDAYEGSGHSHPVISLYYHRVVTLRQYLLQQIPVSSKSRRRRITSVQGATSTEKQKNRGVRGYHAQGLADILDTTLVGVLKESSPTVTQERLRDFASYSQSQSQGRSEVPSTDVGPPCAQSEIVDFVISALFNRHAFSYQKPQHLLTHGFQRAGGPDVKLASSIPGLARRYPNKNVQCLKQAPWTDVLGLLGGNGEEIMLRLLFDCGIFMAIDHRKGIYYQISGLPLSSLEPIQNQSPLEVPNANSKPSLAAGSNVARKNRSSDQGIAHKPNSVVFFRRRMLYAKPILNSRGEVHFGLSALHVLNRYPRSDSLSQTVHILKYIFPRQFGLHNVFTSVTDSRETVLPFKDYFSRETEIEEIEEKRRKQRRRIGPEFTNHYQDQKEFIDIPKRLRGKACELVQQLQNRNRRCPYTELLNYYCPPVDTGPWKLGPTDSQTSHPSGTAISESLVTQRRGPQGSFAHASPLSHLQETPSVATFKAEATVSKILKPKLCLIDYATPCSSVSAFCRAALRKLVPPRFYGTGCHQRSNQDIVFRHVDRFVRMRRFESLSLHEVCKGIKITCMPWLGHPANQQDEGSSQPKMSLSDLRKRTELLHEFIYYIFESILVPLIRSNFYVTESQSHRNRLFYFRHDVWRQLTQQPLAEFKTSLFEEMKRGVAERRLSSRSLGYSSLRLLPKTTGVRPILNLRRRMLKPGWAGKAPFLGPSINSTIAPVFNVLNYEKRRNPDSLGAALSFVGEIHTRLKGFKERLTQKHAGHPRPHLYFVKVDIQSCFDTIPQENLVPLVESLVSEEGYYVAKHVEVRPSDEFSSMWPLHESQQSKALRKYVGRAAPVTNSQDLTEAIAEGGISHRRNTVFVDTVAHKEYSGDYLLDLLDEHIRYNLVRVGKKYFRQRNGIPQGSILSGVLCNLFYARMERECLGFLQSDESVLLRLIDDFLLVTTDSSLAMRFLQVMLKGQPEYGITVNPAKSLVNFAAAVDGVQIPRLVDSALFPYCGSLINTATLEIYRDPERVVEGGDSAAATLASSLTVESARAPGRSLHRKMLSAFKLQMHPMYLDTQHNSLSAVLSNLYASFVTAAMKMYQYMKALPRRAHPTAEVMARVIRDLMYLAHRMVGARRELHTARGPGSPSLCLVQGAQVQYLATAAFRFVLGRKQTKYAGVLRWLEQVWKAARPPSSAKAMRLAQVVRQGNASFAGWRF
ncbi:telomerase reverse transcriptase [Aspergillus clavatus NRRL 1]|uniref:Telomerase reverse transcriptase n=1 Tax=Aspergillus clavatus (strain ATCC 1007 / CBS 513.65 / DSM 816 / NCTC 3887 / NRRL 1 / QM 1276 / 107) TaxID=344612 RepID=A1CDE4_ASPCL|nr:telomerase reverse transcriptase [Aspergillus clavatus NRRL 1]EAW11871.1 telomerase reverse transcriptase [Aspergillus clavatus NRRL 1]